MLIIFFYFFMLLAGFLFWIFDIMQLRYVVILAVLASCATVTIYGKIKFGRRTLTDFILNLLFLAGIITLAVMASILIFDNSYDGQTYHYETIMSMINGWNPVKQVLTTGTSNIFFINHYAKGYEAGAAFLGTFFKNPESGKALNILVAAACYLYVFYMIKKLKIYEHGFWLFFIPLPVALNPVTVYQLFTFYVDGQLAVLVTLLIASLYLSMKTRSTLHLVIASIIFCLLGNIKFTGLVYAIVIFSFFGWWMVFRKVNISRFIAAGAIAFIVAFFAIGFNPYITNIIQQANPFYPLVGRNKIDIITPVEPAGFVHKNALQKFAEANFSRSHNVHGHAITPEPVFKVPFSFSVNEWLVFKGSECRIAGYGPLFGGILLISLILLVSAVFIKRKGIIKKDPFIIAILLFLTLVVNPEMWMSRYVPQLWLCPFCIIWLLRQGIYPAILRKISLFIFILIPVNIAGIALVNWGVAGLISYKMHKELSWLKSLPQPLKMVTNDFIAAPERMQYYGIEVNSLRRDSSVALPGRDTYQLQNSQAVIFLPPGVIKFKNTGILKLLDKKLE